MNRKVIIDTDMGWDDVLSIAYLMKRQDIDILGITVTGCGETDLGWGVIIAQHLLGIGNRLGTVVAKGTDQPLEYDNRFPQPFKNDMNDIMGLLGTLNPATLPELSSLPAWEFMYQTVKNSQDPITVLSLGGFTNIAKMLSLSSQSADFKMVEQIVAMAGAVYVDGNVAALNNAQEAWDQGEAYSSNHYAEWNVFVDPVAANTVFQSSLPLTLVPLDVCNQIILDASYWQLITATDPVATLVKQVLEHKSGTHAEGLPVPIFDPLATMLMAGGIAATKIDEQFLSVNTELTPQDNHCGQIQLQGSGSRMIASVLGVSQVAFSNNFAQVINS
ncbi:Inosine-uridine preferring nucleoside hydrolase [Pseudomonas syringae pv. aceris]|uniref:nucleoside hydrolase n=1 Tax=Pseudomonas syringae TaxID=317 RepID=UPI000EFF0DBA|nr:nucleoside hydrolase [Pseudomonas syringae]MCK9748542.1 nucleoside hydrolase [Pseudomonas syringae pv. syringae]MCK9750428.1 nucleoside hydrolase [Pseudomonas syringae pv. syringae]RMS60647.1 Inosine-uridine preferring nucleoside hydrolase [Pseudomonas syringae pv. aceris]RMS66524.1 Inosine-uridine preferring nucleoside hydrolase [Pseudomonas syringae pv. aceris]